MNQGDRFGVLESVKEMSDLISPVTGTVIEVNSAVLDDPGLINDDAMNSGWLIKVEMDSERELAKLSRVEDYRNYVLGKSKFKARAGEPSPEGSET